MSNSYWNYLEHSAKGTTWKKKKHKYLFIKKGRYYYKYDLGNNKIDETDVFSDYSEDDINNDLEFIQTKHYAGVSDFFNGSSILKSYQDLEKIASNPVADLIVKSFGDYYVDFTDIKTRPIASVRRSEEHGNNYTLKFLDKYAINKSIKTTAIEEGKKIVNALLHRR